MKPSLHITLDKREIKDFPKLSSATSFISKTLYELYENYQTNKMVEVQKVLSIHAKNQ
jgi:hypothetical protein